MIPSLPIPEEWLKNIHLGWWTFAKLLYNLHDTHGRRGITFAKLLSTMYSSCLGEEKVKKPWGISWPPHELKDLWLWKSWGWKQKAVFSSTIMIYWGTTMSYGQLKIFGNAVAPHFSGCTLTTHSFECLFSSVSSIFSLPQMIFLFLHISLHNWFACKDSLLCYLLIERKQKYCIVVFIR